MSSFTIRLCHHYTDFPYSCVIKTSHLLVVPLHHHSVLRPPFTATPHIRHYTNIQQGHAVAQLVEALRNKPEGRWFDSPWCH